MEAHQIVLKNEGWNVVPENGKFFVYRWEIKATVYDFDTQERAWEWLIYFLKGLEGVGIGSNLNN